MDKDWLQKLVTVEDAEAAHSVHDARLGPDPIPFGFQNDKWLALLSQKQAGDELWEFASPSHSLAHSAGRAGLALVRSGEVIATIVTRLS